MDTAASTSLIGKCLRRCGPKQRGKILESYAAEVVIATRILGPRGAGESLGKVLFDKTVTATPILKVVAMVESREIPVTKEQLLAVVQQDESAMRFYALNPWIIDPTGKSAPPPKKGRKPKRKLETQNFEIDEPAPTPPPGKKAPKKTAPKKTVKKPAATKPAKTPATQPPAVQPGIGVGTGTPPPAAPPKEPSKPPTPPHPTTGSLHSPEDVAKMHALLNADDEEDAKLYS